MRQELLELVRCSACGGSRLELKVEEQDEVEVRKGVVTCLDCGQEHRCEAGILDLLKAENEQIANERSGWAQLATTVRNDDELMLQLPDPEDPAHRRDWMSQSQNFHRMWAEIGLRSGERVLDLGAGRCWTTRRFAAAGCRSVAMDVLVTKYVGLSTADVFIRHDGNYFDRVCGDMNEVPFQNGAFDLVFLTATLHHTSFPERVLGEVARVLRPGGRLVMINEPVVGLRQSTAVTCVEREHGINENLYRLPTYLRALRRAGFKPRLYPYVGRYAPGVDRLNAVAQRAWPPARRRRVLTPLVYAQHLHGPGILNLIATKAA